LRFKRVVLDAVATGFGRVVKEEELKWKFNRKESQIEAWLEDVLAFRSKKFNLKELEKTARKYSFKNTKNFEDKGFSITIFEKT